MADKLSIFPPRQWWHLVNKKSLKADLMAGFTGAIIVLPQGIAFAMIAGLPPIFGLYTAILTPVVAALFGSSHHMVSGPTTTSSIAVFATISLLATPLTETYITLALVLTIMVGVIQLSLGLARLGALVNFISHAVVTGFTAGAAALIATSQIRHILGLTIPRTATFSDTWLYIFTHLPDVNMATLLLGVGTLIVGVVFKNLLPRWPYLLFAMLAGTLAAFFFGSDAYGIPLVGELPRGLPSWRIPIVEMSKVKELIPGAFAVAMLGAIEVISISRSIAAKSRQRLDSNQEFVGLGLSNVVGGFFSCYVGSGSYTRSGLNYASGAKTPLAAVSASLSLLVIVLLVAPWAAYLPIPTMGGIILIVAYSLIDFHSIRKISKASRSEIAVLIITFLATLIINLQFAILAGVFFSLIFYLMRTSNPKIAILSVRDHNGKRKFTNADVHELKTCPQLHIIRIDGSLFFGAVENIKTFIHDLSESKRHILIVGTGINFIDASGAEMLLAESERLKSLGGGLYFCQVKKVVREFLDRGYIHDMGPENFYLHKEEAVAAIYAKLDRTVCRSCEARIFTECVE